MAKTKIDYVEKGEYRRDMGHIMDIIELIVKHLRWENLMSLIIGITWGVILGKFVIPP